MPLRWRIALLSLSLLGQQSTQVIPIVSQYAVAPGGRSGFPATGQDADVVLSAHGFNRSGGPLLFHHPRGLAGDGQRLLLADSNNNRVLIWSSLPDGNTPPDLVIGQPDMESNDPGSGAGGMNWPGQISVGPDGQVLVADSFNDRLLLWNSFPSTSGQPADIVIRTPDLRWPWGVWTDGKRLVATSTGNRAVLFWNQLPEQGDEPPDFVIRHEAIGTPRTITSDGQRLIIGDHNAYQTRIGNFFWKTFPRSAEDVFDFFMPDPLDGNAGWMQGTFLPGGRLAMLGRTLHVWNSSPENETARPELSISGYRFQGGDGGAVVAAGERLYMPEYNGNRIAVYNSIPEKPGDRPDFAIGSPNLETNTLRTEFLMTNPAPLTDGQSLFVSSDFDRRLYVWRGLPDESGARPDFVYELPFAAWDGEIYGEKLLLAGKDTVAIWDQLPRNGELPARILRGRVGTVTPREIRGVAMDDTYFYLGDQDAGRVWVWRGVPQDGEEPLFSLPIRQPSRISSDGTHVLILSTETHTVAVYRVSELGPGAEPRLVPGMGLFNLPQGAIIRQGQVVVCDTTGNRVHLWKDVEDFVARRPATAILGTSGPSPRIGTNTLFWPGVPAFDGSYLWVGEFKFSGRLPRFSAGIR